jgi:signal transduction histidine kinase
MMQSTSTDMGSEVPAADLPRVFERGYRASNVAPQMDGWGVGLAGVQDTVAEHGGAIEVESQECVGTTVTVRVPLGEPAVGDPSGCGDTA